MDKPIKRLHPNMVSRLENYIRETAPREKRKITLIEASRRFADRAVMPDDRLNSSLKRIGKKWRWVNGVS